MSKSSPPRITGRDVAGAGALLLSANLMCAAVGAGIGALFGAALALGIIGFLIGFLVGINVVIRRFRDI
jgi:F0F1-type ATP synthase assembly protein I